MARLEHNQPKNRATQRTGPKHHESVTVPIPKVTIMSRYYYIDKLQLWSPDILPRSVQKQLQSLCGSMECKYPVFSQATKTIYGAGTRPLRQRIQLSQPSTEAFRFLVELGADEWLVNKIECAHDLIMGDAKEVAKLQDFLVRTWLQSHHGSARPEKVGGTHYNAWRSWKTRNQYVHYIPRCCKMTGEANCLHLEWRTNQAEALRAHGIGTVSDLIDFDHETFWRKKLILFHADAERLGRFYSNHFNGSRRRHPWLQKWGETQVENIDVRTGEILMRAAQQGIGRKEPIRPAGAVQDLVDEYGQVARRSFIPIPTDLMFNVPAEIIKDRGMSVG